jgi:hypothetical protein
MYSRRQQGGCRLLGRLAVVVWEDVSIGLEEETDVGVADPFADDLRAHPSSVVPLSRKSAAGRER